MKGRRKVVWVWLFGWFVLTCINAQMFFDMCTINQWNNNYAHTEVHYIALNITFYFLK
jgi:hypothetical protein